MRIDKLIQMHLGCNIFNIHKVPIDYTKISQAKEFYTKNGFNYIDVPWLVSKEVMDITSPCGEQYWPKFKNGYIVASAEHSFIELLKRGVIETGDKLQTITPCFRHEGEKYGLLHNPGFMKLELINISENDTDLLDMLNTARDFFNSYIETHIVNTEIGFDIVSKKENIELGSYGHRQTPYGNFIYGTGLAEPRLSYILNLQERGYSMMDIRKGTLGDISKIEEELNELKDADTQQNKIMSLVELSDLYGAIQSFLQSNFDGISMDDLQTMSDTTKRAFKSGRRR